MLAANSTMTDLRLAKAKKDADTLESALSVIDDLRAKVASGEVKAFVAVGITPDHETLEWAGYAQKTTRLEMQGAIMQLFREY